MSATEQEQAQRAGDPVIAHASAHGKASEGAGPVVRRRWAAKRGWRINTRLLLQSVAIVGVCSIALHYWHAHQVEGNAATLLTRAERQRAAGQWAQAADCVERYLRLRPSDVAARVQLASDFDHAAQGGVEKVKALRLLATAIALAPRDLELRRRHASLALELGLDAMALEHAESLLEQAPQDATGLRVKALALLARWRQKTEKSVGTVQQAFEAAHHAEPSNATVALELARLYRLELKEPATSQRERLADAVMDQLVAANSDASEALAARYAYRRDFQLPGADDDLDSALDLAQHAEKESETRHSAVFLAAGLRAQSRQDWPQAIQYFERAATIAPDDQRGYFWLAQAHRSAGDPQAALKTLARGMRNSGAVDLRLEAEVASIEIGLGRLEAAEETLARMHQQAIDLFGAAQTQGLATVAALRAQVLLARKDYAGAAPLLQRVLALRQGGGEFEGRTVANAEAHRQLGACFAELGQWDQAAAAYEAAAHLQPQLAAAFLAAGQAWENAGWLDRAVRDYEDGLAAEGASAAAWEHLANARFRQQIMLPASKRDWQPFREALARAGAASPGAASLSLLESDYEAAIGHVDTAAALLDAIETQVLNAPRLAAALALRYERLGRSADADRVVDSMQGDEAEMLSALARCQLALHRNHDDQAEQLLSAAIGKLSGAARLTLQYRRARLAIDRGSLAEARKQLDEIVREEVRPIRAVQLLAELALERGDLAEAERQEDRLRKLEQVEGQTGWRFYRAQRLIADSANVARQTDEIHGSGKQQSALPADNDQHSAERLIAAASEEGRALERIRPYWAPTHLLKARLAQRGRQPDDDAAIDAFSEALRLGERRMQVYQELIGLLFRNNRVAEAAALIDRLREADEVPRELASAAMAADVSLGNYRRAVRLAAEEVRRTPDDAMNRVRLGQLLLLDLPAEESARAARRAEAEAELQQARRLAPQDPRPWSALLAFYHTTGQTPQARELLQEIEREGFLDAKNKPFYLAQAYQLLGDDDQAKAHYLRAVEVNPSRASVILQAGEFFFRREPARAEEYLRRAHDLEPDNRATARMLAALIALRSGDKADLDEVWKLLDSDKFAGAPDIADRRLKAILLLRRGGDKARERARLALESLVAQGSQSAPVDHLLLARLYEAQGENGKARQQFQALVESQTAQPEHLAAFADYLLRNSSQNSTAAAQIGQLLDQLNKREPAEQSFRTVALRARWYKLQKQDEQIAPLVDAFLAGAGAGEKSGTAQRLLSAAGLYEQLEMPVPAEASYRQAFAISPACYPPLALWLARRGRVSEAIDLCHNAAAADPSGQAAIALAGVLTVGSATDSERLAAEPIIADALKRRPRDLALLFAAATWRAMQGEDETAVRLLRQLLEIDPRHAPALNNLAMILARQHGGGGEAIELIDQALEVAGAESELLDTKGWIMLEQQRPADAEAAFQEALAMPPQSPRYRFHLSLAYERQGKRDAALQAFHRAVDTGLQRELLTPLELAEFERFKASAP